jgi:hypothetical protein
VNEFALVAAVLAQAVPTPAWDSLTVAGLLGLIVMSFLNEWVVTGKAYRREREQLQKDVDFWRDLALENLGLADKAVSLAEKQVRK